MEDAIFTNHTIMDQSSCRAFLALAWNKNGGALRILMMVVAVFAVGYGVFQLVAFGATMLPFGILMILMGGVAAFMSLWGYLLRLGRYTRTQQAAWGGATLEKTVYFRDDGMVQITRLGRLNMHYNEIDSLRQGHGALLIGMGDGAVLLHTDGFGAASYADFLRFLMCKCSRAKNIKLNGAVKRALKGT